MPSYYYTGLTGLIKLTKLEYESITHDPKTKYIVKDGNSVKEYLGDIPIGIGNSMLVHEFTVVYTRGITGAIVNLEEASE